jgi:hypothetical protein
VDLTELLAQLVTSASAVLPPEFEIPLTQTRQHFFSDFLTHGHQLGLPVAFFFESMSFPSVLSSYPRGIKTYAATGDIQLRVIKD